MNKIELQQYLDKGYKMTHEYFSPDEFIYLKDGEIHDENGYKMRCNGPNNQIITFWTDRQGPEWNDGWSIYVSDGDKLLEANKEYIRELNEMEMIPRNYPTITTISSPVYFSHKSHKRTNKRH